MITFAISIAHAAHRPERKPILAKMMEQLFRRSDGWPVVHIEDAPGKPHEWSLRQWEGAISGAASHCLLLNDDLVLCAGFMSVLAKVVTARPNHIINLYNSHELANVARANGYSWLTSVDGLIGNAYVIPTDHLRAFLDWRANALADGAVETLSEDQLINLWAMEQGALCWHTVPALVDHDTSVPSCFENTQLRKPDVGPIVDIMSVNWDTNALHIGRLFKGNHYALVQKLKAAKDPSQRGQLIERYYAMAREAMQ